MERTVYIHRALQDHLLNKLNYIEISQDIAYSTMESVYRNILALFIDDKRDPTLDKSSRLFFERKLLGLRDCHGIVQQPAHMQLPYFYILPKVHKKPWKTRPVVSQVSSVIEPLSQWIDYQLQRVIHLCPAYLQDSWHFLNELKKFKRNCSSALIFTADAVAMYANIPTEHALTSIKQWFELHAHELPADFPTTKVLTGLGIVMRNNVFTFGNRYWLQLQGTAMGTSCACMYANIYYSYHEETRLTSAPTLWFWRRLIDDGFGIIDGTCLTHFHQHMQLMNNFGPEDARLVWECELGTCKSINFLDLQVTIEPDGTFTTRTYQKAMNLYLYRPPCSAQPPSILYGLIFGTLHRYFWHNSKRSDFQHFTKLFFERLCNRGHVAAHLAPLFIKAAAAVDTSQPPQPKIGPHEVSENPRNRFFLHLPYHPLDPERRVLQQIFRDTLSPALAEDSIGLETMTIAYSRSPNISDLVRRNRLPSSFDTNL